MITPLLNTAWEQLYNWGLWRITAYLYITYEVLVVVYNIWFHPLRDFPGPVSAAASPFARISRILVGREPEWLTELHGKYGHVVRVSPNELSYTHPDAWRDIYSSGSKLAGRKWKGLYNKKIPQLQTLQGANDQEHAELRRLFLPAFTEKALREQQPLLKQYAEQIVNRLRRYVDETPENQEPIIDLVPVFNYVTFDIMGDLAFGKSMNMIEELKTVDWIKTHFEGVKKGIIFTLAGYHPFFRILTDVFFWLFKDAVWASYRIVAGYVDERLAQKDSQRSDIMGLVLRAQEKEGGRKLSQHEIYTHSLLFMFAGTETTSTLLAGLISLLLSHPEKLEKLKTEILAACKSPEDMTIQNLAQLSYLHACIEEAFRIYPPVPVGVARTTPPEGAVIADRWVPPDAVVYVSQLAAYRSESNFRRPNEFLPERWLSPEFKSDHRSVVQPFIVGPRNCLGKGLAYHEMRLVLAYMLYHFEFEPVEPTTDWIDQQKIWFLWHKNPLRVKLIPTARE